MSLSKLQQNPSAPVLPAESPRLPPDVVREIQRMVSRIEYGSVEIVIHGSQVVQIESREKKRFDSGGQSR